MLGKLWQRWYFFLSPLMNTRDKVKMFLRSKAAAGAYGWQTHRHLCADCLDNVGTSTSHSLFSLETLHINWVYTAHYRCFENLNSSRLRAGWPGYLESIPARFRYYPPQHVDRVWDPTSLLCHWYCFRQLYRTRVCSWSLIITVKLRICGVLPPFLIYIYIHSVMLN
jgi:hypothetical protein